jgi:hypothetical protein
MDQVGDRLDVIDGLRVFRYPPPVVTGDAAIVSYPDEYTFDATYGRGMDTMTLPLVLVVPRPTERTTRDRLAGYCDGSGSKSVKELLESGDYAAFDSLRVAGITFDVVSIGGTDFAAALFDLNLAGSGST